MAEKNQTPQNNLDNNSNVQAEVKVENQNATQPANNVEPNVNTEFNNNSMVNNQTYVQNPYYSNGYNPYGYVAKPKKIIEYTKMEHVLSFVTLIIGFFILHFTVWNTTGFFTSALYVGIVLAGSYYMKKKGHKFLPLHKALMIILILFSLVYCVTANTFIKFLNTVFMLFAGTYYIYLIGGEQSRIGRYLPLELIKSAFSFPFKNMYTGQEAISSVTKKSKIGSNAKILIFGVLLAVPITCVVGSLLMSADNGVRKFLVNILENISSRNIIIWLLKFGCAIPVGFYMFGMMFANTRRKEQLNLDDENCEGNLKKIRVIQNAILYIAVTPICFLYVVFFISQINYFMSAFAGTLPSDYSYAEYARQGFFELLAIEIINIGVIAFINLFSKKSGREKTGALKFYSTIISFFTLVIIATAISKMIMYINEYGLTQLRVYTTWFMILTAIIFVLIIIKQFRFDMKFAQWVTGVFLVMFAVLCFSRPDALIARYNLEYHSYSLKLYDLTEMVNMSDDACSVILEPQYEDLITDIFADDTRENLIEMLDDKYKDDVYRNFNISALKINRYTS